MSTPVLRAEPVIRALQGTFARDVPREKMLALCVRRMREAGTPYDGVAVYLAGAEGFELAEAVGAEGWLERLPPDGAADDPSDGSVLTMPILLRQETLGLLVVRSSTTDAFDPAEEAAVREVADALAVLL